MHITQQGNPQYYCLCFAVSEPQEITHSAVNVFVRNTQLIGSEGKSIFVSCILLLQFICLHVWSIPLFNAFVVVLPGMYSHCSEIGLSWPFRNMWLISFPQWHLSSKVQAERAQLPWIISNLHISANHLTMKIYAKILKTFTSFCEICCPFNVFESQDSLGEWTTDIKLQVWAPVLPFINFIRVKKSGKSNNSEFCWRALCSYISQVMRGIVNKPLSWPSMNSA